MTSDQVLWLSLGLWLSATLSLASSSCPLILVRSIVIVALSSRAAQDIIIALWIQIIIATGVI